MTAQGKRILLFCIAYHNYAEVQSFVRHVLDQKGSGALIDVIIVDNTWPSPADPEIWLSEFKHDVTSGRLQLISSNANLGYFGAFRAALAHAKRQNFDQYDWIIASNTDIVFETPGWAAVVSEFPTGVGVIAPKIISAISGKNQNPLYRARPRALKFALLSVLFRSYWLTLLYRCMAFGKGRCKALFARKEVAHSAIYAPHGSFLCFSRQYFDKGGELACKTFLFCEEIFLAEELTDIGLPALYRPDLVLRHVEHSTTAFVPSKPIRRYLAEAHWASYKLLQKK